LWRRVTLLTGNFYLFWLLLVTVAFLYNAAVGPLRTAFSPAPIYNVTGVYPASSAATRRTDVTASGCVNETSVINNVTSNISFTDAGNIKRRVDSRDCPFIKRVRK